MENEKELTKDFKPYYDNFIKDLFGLLSIDSVLTEFDPKNKRAPFGSGIREALDYTLNLAQKEGFRVVNDDNYGGFLEWGEGEEVVLILAHLDVVPVSSGVWTNPPFKPIIKDGKIYARGSSDDKGPLMACYYALKMLKDEGYEPKKKIRFFFGCDEESGSRCLEHFKEKYPQCDYGFSPDAGFPVIFAEKGISGLQIKGTFDNSKLVSFTSGSVSNIVPDTAKCVLKDINLKDEFMRFALQNNLKAEVNGDEYTLYGKAAHGSIPEEGINAALYLGYFLSSFIDTSLTNFIKDYLFFDFNGEKLGIDCHDDEMGDVSSNAGVFRTEGNAFSIVINMRYPRNFDFNEKMIGLKELVESLGLKFSVLSNSRYHYVQKNSILIRALLKSYKKWTTGLKVNTEPVSIGGGTYARDFENCVGFGAEFSDEEDTMHMPDENKQVDRLVLSSFIYKDAIKNLCD